MEVNIRYFQPVAIFSHLNDYINIYNPRISIIFGLKSRTIRGIKLNFKNQYTENTLCPICERAEDTQEHVGCCPVLLGIKPQATLPLYENIYGNVHQQKEVAQIYLQLLQLRDELLAGGTDQSPSIAVI